MRLLGSVRRRRAERALERNRDYQRTKARWVEEEGDFVVVSVCAPRAEHVRSAIEAVAPLSPDKRVLEVGSGAHGNVFFLGHPNAVGVDPMAREYKALFPGWQGRCETIEAFGEHLPFPDASFDVVISDNVVDHAEDPGGIAREIVRVTRPGGVIYFAVNVHHPIYDAMSRAYSAWVLVGSPLEVSAFADHTVHLTAGAARRLFDGLPVERLEESVDVESASRLARESKPRHLGDRLKRVFFKNALYELVARRLATC